MTALSPTQRACSVCNRMFISEGRSTCSPICLTESYRRAGRISAAMVVRRSHNEMLFFELVHNRYPEAQSNQVISAGWDADVVIPARKVVVLWNGIWHYKKVKASHSLEQVQSRDRLKMRAFHEADYRCYVVKDLGKYSRVGTERTFAHFLEWLRTPIDVEVSVWGEEWDSYVLG